MNDDNSYSLDRLLEFGLGMAVSRQMVQSMNYAVANTQIPGAMTPMPSASPKSYFLALDGKAAGPYNEQELSRLIVTGTLKKDTYTWRAGMSKWQRAEEVPDVLKLVALCPPPFKPESA